MPTPIYQIVDPGRGMFCAVDKAGNAMNLPPVQREPVVNRETNPRGVRHIAKTEQDFLPVAKRPRVKPANIDAAPNGKRLERRQAFHEGSVKRSKMGGKEYTKPGSMNAHKSMPI